MKPVAAQQNSGTSERLESWKEIAVFLGKGVRTVQRWERTEDLPVRRHLHERGGTVYAYKSEVLEWYGSRQSRLDKEPVEEVHEGTPSTCLAPTSVPSARPSPATASAAANWSRRKLAVLAGVGALVVGVWAFAFISARSRPFGGKTVTVLSVVGRASQAVLSSDGRRIAFVWNGEREFGNLDLFIREVERGTPIRLTESPNNEHSPSWSADGHSLVFLRDNEGVFIVRPGEGPPRLVFRQKPGAVYGVGSSWSAPGNLFYYSERNRGDGPLIIYKLNAATGAVEQVTNPGDELGDMYPSLSPDGRSLAFIRQARSLAGAVHLLRLSADGGAVGEPQRLTDHVSRIAGLDWLPDNSGIVFSSDYSGRRRLWMLRRGLWRWKTSPEALAFAGEDAFQPSIAETGGLMLYSRRYWPTAVWRVDLSYGARATPLVKIAASAGQDMEPAWSPAGGRIAFVSTRTGHTEIWTSKADGTGATQATYFGGPLTHSPAWSIDGTTIAFHAGPERASSVFLMPASGGKPTRLTPAGMHSFEPAWSRDGKLMYFTSNQAGPNAIWSIPVEGGTPIRVTAGSGTKPQVSPDGAWLYFRRGGVWRMPIGGGPEEQVVAAAVGTFAVARDLVYFDRGFGDYAPPELHVHELSTGRTRLVSRFERRKSAGLSVSPDGRSLLIPLNDRQSSEIMLVR